MGIPACLWRRTGEIYKGNKEFAALVGVPIEQLRDVRRYSAYCVQRVTYLLIYVLLVMQGLLCIYEMMAEDSAVNYWEVCYLDVAWDDSRRHGHKLSNFITQKYGNIAFDAGQKAVLTSCLLKCPDPENTSVISCCFSFTIRRDKYNM